MKFVVVKCALFFELGAFCLRKRGRGGDEGVESGPQQVAADSSAPAALIEETENNGVSKANENEVAEEEVQEVVLSPQ